tara:strand:- start:146 stop:328 length:183 start_codon:yes stop_codon:yes gene_type:complete
MARMKRCCPSGEARSMQVEGKVRRWKIPDGVLVDFVDVEVDEAILVCLFQETRITKFVVG